LFFQGKGSKQLYFFVANIYLTRIKYKESHIILRHLDKYSIVFGKVYRKHYPGLVN